MWPSYPNQHKLGYMFTGKVYIVTYSMTSNKAEIKIIIITMNNNKLIWKYYKILLKF